MKIKTKDFLLQYPTLKDLDGYYETETDSLSKKMFTSFPKNKEEAKKDLQEHIKNNKKKPIVSETFSIIIDKKYAGYVKIQFQNFDPENDEGRIHVAIHPDFRGKGIATKVIKEITDYGFKKYKFKRIFAQHKAINKGVARINEKLGFKLIKTHKTEGVKKMLWVLERKK